jgi:amino-acid N-acetyltransferase
MIKKASIDDIKQIHSILSFYSKQGVLLGRSLSDLYDQIRDFIISTAPEGDNFAGTCSLHICWENIAEIRSLAVAENYYGMGIGRELVESCIREAAEMGVRKVFVLTYVPGFFKKLGFYPVDKSVLPHKVWSDCINCVKFPDCDEEAMMLDIT